LREEEKVGSKGFLKKLCSIISWNCSSMWDALAASLFVTCSKRKKIISQAQMGDGY